MERAGFTTLIKIRKRFRLAAILQVVQIKRERAASTKLNGILQRLSPAIIL